MQFLCIFHHRQRQRNALVAGAGDDDDRQRAAAPRRGCGGRAHLHGAAGAVQFQQRAAHFAAIALPQPFMGNGHIAFYLPQQKRLYFRKVCRFGKCQDIAHIQKGFIGRGLLHAALHRAALQHCAVLFNAGHMGVCAAYLHKGSVPAGFCSNGDCKGLFPFYKACGAHTRRQQTACFLTRFICHTFQHGKLFFGITARNSEQSGHFDAAQPAGIWHGDALHVFHDISAARHIYPLRHRTQHLARQCARVGNGNWLCAAKRNDKLVFQNVNICVRYVLFHSRFSTFSASFFLLACRPRRRRGASLPHGREMPSTVFLF